MKLICEYNDSGIETLTENTEEGRKTYIEGIFIQTNRENRNKRIYEKAMMEPVIDSFISQKVNTNRAVGELEHPCFDSRAEVLTENRGWASITDITDADTVYTVNKSSGKVEIKQVNYPTKNEYAGKVLTFKGRGCDFTVTPYHKILLKDRNGNLVTMTAQEVYEGWKDRSLAHHSIPKGGLSPIQEENRQIRLEGCSDHRYSRFHDELLFDESAFARFVGFYMAEGCTIKRNRSETDGYRTLLYQRKPKNIEAIDEMLSDLPVSFSKNQQENGTYVWSSSDPRVGKYLHKFGICYDKYLDQKILEMSPQACLEFIKWFNIGDGRKRLCGKLDDVFSTSERLIDDISHLAAKCGIATNKNIEIPEKDTEIEGRVILAENKQPMYLLSLLSTKGIYIDNKYLNIVEEDYSEEYVYCLNVENNTFYARCEGQTFWTGNCSPEIDLNNVSHRIVEMSWHGDNVVGKALVLNTPKGQIVNGLIEGGVKFGVSSRGMGSLVQKEGVGYVDNDFILGTVDIVQDPSAQDAFVNGILEGVEWCKSEHGWEKMQERREIEQETELQRFTDKDRLKLLESFLSNLKAIS